VGGRSDAALARTARFADGWLPIFMTVDRFGQDNDRLDALLVARGRDQSSVRRGVVALAATTGSSWTAQRSREWIGELWGMNPAMLDRYLITGSADEVVAHLARYAEAGADHVVVLPATPDPVPVIEALNSRFLQIFTGPMAKAR
jgi:alkanesulfonate monooxygenase SsuD/methylene tetrahydromethanopterin reductase-like flavin-dependent oxidoreductase (luciferase family)